MDNRNNMMDGLIYQNAMITQPECLYQNLMEKIVWDERMLSRKTASFGQAYQYSQMYYEEQPFLAELEDCILQLEHILGFKANNCLINYYPDGRSKMGWHADQWDVLADDTGIAIISLGAERHLHFRSLPDYAEKKEYLLESGSLIYMTQHVQKHWQHQIPSSETTKGRLSLTFRQLKIHHFIF